MHDDHDDASVYHCAPRSMLHGMHKMPFPLVPDHNMQLLVSSEDRDTYKYPNANHFTVPVPDTLRNGDRLQAVTLDHIAIPNVAYPINSTCNRLWITEDGDSDEVTPTEAPTTFYLDIPPATYTATSLVTTLNNIAANWLPHTSAAAPPNGSAVLKTDTVENVYKFFHDTDHYRIAFRASVGDGGTYRAVQIHCPPIEFTNWESRDVTNMRQYSTDMQLTDASNLGSDVIRVSFGGTRGNIVTNAPIDLIVIRSTSRTSKEIRFANVVLYSATGDKYATGTSISSESFDIHIDGASTIWTNKFDDTLDKNFNGFVRMTCATGSAWRMLGFTNSVDAKTNLVITSVADGDLNGRTQHKLTCSLPMYLDTATDITIPSDSTLLNIIDETAEVNKTLATESSSTTLSFANTEWTFNTAINLGTNPIIYRHGYFVGDSIIDMRGSSLSVMLRLRINGVEVGRIVRAGNGGSSMLPPHSGVEIAPSSARFFGEIFMDTIFGNMIERFRESHRMGEFQHFYHPVDPSMASAIIAGAQRVAVSTTTAVANDHHDHAMVSQPTGFENVVHRLEVELFTDKGVRLDLGKHWWSFTLGLRYVSSNDTPL